MKKKAFPDTTLISITVSMEHCLAESPSTSVYNDYADENMQRLSDQRDYSEEICDE